MAGFHENYDLTLVKNKEVSAKLLFNVLPLGTVSHGHTVCIYSLNPIWVSWNLLQNSESDATEHSSSAILCIYLKYGILKVDVISLTVDHFDWQGAKQMCS